MTKPIKEDLGTYSGRIYWLRGRAKPGFNDPEWFSVSVYYTDRNSGDNIEIVRVDRSHNYTHIHRLYRRDELKEPIGWDLWEAWGKFKREWRTYAKNFENK
jgi:hypothetical protein